MTETVVSKAKLFSKIAQVMLAVRTLSKDGVNTYDKYGYVTADSAFEHLGQAMGNVNLVALPSVVECVQSEVPSAAGKAQTRTIVHGQITLACGDTGETWTDDWWGEGIDRSDKSINKAITAMTKYHLLRLFNVGTNEDADSESPEIEQPAKRQPPTPQHRTPRPPAPRPNPVPQDENFYPEDDNPFADVPNHKAKDEAIATSAASLYSSDRPMTELASRLTAKCIELHGTSGGKKLSTTNKDGTGAGQYGLLAGKLDHLTGQKGSHNAMLSALTGENITKDNPPGWKVKEIIDWLNDEKSKANTEQALRDVWAALQEMA